MEKREVIRNALLKLLGFVIYLILLGFLNIMSLYVSNPIFLGITNMLNQNILIILLLVFIFFLVSLFNKLKYPYNLPAPVFSGFSVIIILRILLLVMGIINTNNPSVLFTFLEEHSLQIYILFLLLVLTAMYIIFVRKREYEEIVAKTRR